MTVDATIPVGTTLGSDLPAIIRENRTEINLLYAAIAALGGVASYENLSLAGGATDLPLTGAGLIHTVALGAAAGANIATITGGVEGMLLLIKATGANITLVHADAIIHLNGAADFVMAANDFILLLYESSWIEVFRTVHV